MTTASGLELWRDLACPYIGSLTETAPTQPLERSMALGPEHTHSPSLERVENAESTSSSLHPVGDAPQTCRFVCSLSVEPRSSAPRKTESTTPEASASVGGPKPRHLQGRTAPSGYAAQNG